VLPFRNVPHSDGAIFTIRNNELVLGVEEDAGDIVGVSSHGVDLPCLQEKEKKKNEVRNRIEKKRRRIRNRISYVTKSDRSMRNYKIRREK
jgi:hypothetical protein